MKKSQMCKSGPVEVPQGKDNFGIFLDSAPRQARGPRRHKKTVKAETFTVIRCKTLLNKY